MPETNESQEKTLPDSGGWYDLYYNKDTKEEGLHLTGRDVVVIHTPELRVTPPEEIRLASSGDTDTVTFVKNIDGKEYRQPYVIKYDAQNNPISVKLPYGPVITISSGTGSGQQTGGE